MDIFRLTEDDVENYKNDIITMLKQSFIKSFPGTDINDDYYCNRIRTLKEYIKEGKAIVYATKNGTGLSGFIWFYPKDTVDGRVLHIVHFVVHDKCRRHGIGIKLLEKAEEFALSKKIQHSELIVTKDNVDAVSFYRKRDFQVKRLVMKKRLLE